MKIIGHRTSTIGMSIVIQTCRDLYGMTIGRVSDAVTR
jgi:hypothetical protein